MYTLCYINLIHLGINTIASVCVCDKGRCAYVPFHWGILRCLSHTSVFHLSLPVALFCWGFSPVAAPDCVYAWLSVLRAEHNLLIIWSMFALVLHISTPAGWTSVSETCTFNLSNTSSEKPFGSTLKQVQYMIVFSSAATVTLKTAAQ